MHLSTFIAVLMLFGLTVTEGHAQGKVCCDLLIFEPASDAGVAYAVKRRGGGVVIAEYTPGNGWRVIEGKAARAMLAGWSAASRKEETTSVFIDARESSFHIDRWDEPDEAEDSEADDGDTLVLIHKASARQALSFINDIDDLPADKASRLRAMVPAK